MDVVTRKKWDNASIFFDLMNGFGPEKRWKPVKQRFFSGMNGRVLFLAVGTGLDFKFFPPERDIVGIDISPKMLEKAAQKARSYSGRIELQEQDVTQLDFPDESFDQVYTSCTFCSVPDPVKGLKELKRVLKPQGELRMLEHTGSRYFPFSLMLNVMTLLSRTVGPDMNRDTVGNLRKAGFLIKEIDHIYLDVLKTIYAVLPSEN